MLSPDKFDVNEAWIVFQLNDMAIETESDGNFNCIAVMDAASCFIVGSELVAADTAEISQLDSLRLLSLGKKHKPGMPSRILVSASLAANLFCQEAIRKGAQVERPLERELLPFIGEARSGFEQYRKSLR